MTTLENEITIAAPREKVWAILTDLGALDAYDPTVANAEVTSAQLSGVGASRKVDMADGRHWFSEEMTLCEPTERLAFELTACNFPISSLRHSYEVESVGEGTRVSQRMEYTVKYGPLGVLMDKLVLRRQSDAGIKKFFAGLKEHAES